MKKRSMSSISSRNLVDAVLRVERMSFVERVQRVDYLTIENSFSPYLPGPGLTLRVSTYRSG